MLPLEHSAILLTFIKLPFVFKIFGLSIFEWPLYTGFTVYCFYAPAILNVRGGDAYSITSRTSRMYKKCFLKTLVYWIHMLYMGIHKIQSTKLIYALKLTRPRLGLLDISQCQFFTELSPFSYFRNSYSFFSTQYLKNN